MLYITANTTPAASRTNKLKVNFMLEPNLLDDGAFATSSSGGLLTAAQMDAMIAEANTYGGTFNFELGVTGVGLSRLHGRRR